MELKTYQADSMAQALQRVKKDLGSEAVILHTRTMKKGGLMGVGARTVVEITASRDPSLLPAVERRAIIGRTGKGGGSYQDDMGSRSPRVRQAEGAAMSRAPLAGAEPASREEVSQFVSDLRGGMSEIRAMVRELLDRPAQLDGSEPAPPDVPEELRQYYTRLIQNAVAEEIARDVIAEATERLRGGGAHLEDAVQAVLIECIGSLLPPAEPIELTDRATKYVALVGPTGVGKTTTIAKLAAHFKLRQGKRVGLITIDTYRIAAVEQLKAYADILNVPLQVVLAPEEMAPALKSMSDLDLVLIDTSGRSQRDTRRVDELKAFLDAARAAAEERVRDPGGVNLPARGPDGRFRPRNSQMVAPISLEVHLVLSCTSHPAQLIEAAEKFAAVGVNRAVFTKLDEAVGLGVILNVIRRLNLQLSYLTTGQDVPDDIEVGHRRRLAEMILEPAAVRESRNDREVSLSPSMEHVA